MSTQFCRCCLTNGCYKNMYNEYYVGDRKEIYADMLVNTFNINLLDSERNGCFICEACITKLRGGTLFKEQVLMAQETIKKINNNGENVNLVGEDDDDGFDDEVNSRFNDSDFDWENKKDTEKGEVFFIKLEPKKNISKKVSRKSTPKKIPNLARVDKESTNIPRVTLTRCDTSSWQNTEVSTAKGSSSHLSVKKQSVKDEKKMTGSVKGRPKKTCSINTQISKTEINSCDNTLKLIQNSNLCLFRSLKTKYACVLCKASFVEPLQLREHVKTHSNTKKIAYSIKKLRGLSYKKVDISNLECTKCSESIQDLSELMIHLKNKHDIPFSGTNHFLIPFKLLEGHQCVICQNKFHSFLRLSIHMNSHSTNNVCEICGLPFINRSSLRMHVLSMHIEKRCPRCPAKFLTYSTRVQHLRKVHNICNRKRYCNLCDKTFRYTYLLVKHKIEEHGAKENIVNCEQCGKSFVHETNLKVHIRSVHFKERNYPCEVCGTRFFTKFDQKRHEKTHNDRSFTCNFCDGKFKSKDSCRRHLKKLHGHTAMDVNT